MAGEKLSGLANVLFVATHPVLSLRAKSRQIGVAIEHQAPPTGTTFEDFTKLSLADAARVMFSAQIKERKDTSGCVWSAADQERMAQGQMPKGHPEHQNV